MKKGPVLSKAEGFSLVELVIVIGLLSLLALGISSVMLMTIVTNTRLRTATRLKQAGGSAVSQIQILLRNAKSVTFCDSPNNTIQIINGDGQPTTLMMESDGTNTRIASNSGIYLTPIGTAVSLFSLTCDPADTDPTLVNLAFNLTDTLSTSTTNPSLHFETAIQLRNE